MKITRIEAFPIRAPRARRFAAAQAADFALVTIETDAGIVGYGEVSSALLYYRLGPSHAYDINAYLGPALIGEDPLMIPALIDRMDRDGRSHSRVGSNREGLGGIGHRRKADPGTAPQSEESHRVSEVSARGAILRKRYLRPAIVRSGSGKSGRSN